MTKCDKCGITKTWNGDDIKCPFSASDTFSSDNWNCGIIDKLRTICETAISSPDIHTMYCEDLNTYSVLRIEQIRLNTQYIGSCLWIGWYKNRGCTESMYILDVDAIPRQPTFDELLSIYTYYKNKLQL